MQLSFLSTRFPVDIAKTRSRALQNATAAGSSIFAKSQTTITHTTNTKRADQDKSGPAVLSEKRGASVLANPRATPFHLIDEPQRALRACHRSQSNANPISNGVVSCTFTSLYIDCRMAVAPPAVRREEKRGIVCLRATTKGSRPGDQPSATCALFPSSFSFFSIFG